LPPLPARLQISPAARAARAQVLLEFPIEVVSALVAGRWAARASAARPFLAGYRLRLGMAAIVTTMVRPRPRRPLKISGSWAASCGGGLVAAQKRAVECPEACRAGVVW